MAIFITFISFIYYFSFKSIPRGPLYTLSCSTSGIDKSSIKSDFRRNYSQRGTEELHFLNILANYTKWPKLGEKERIFGKFFSDIVQITDFFVRNGPRVLVINVDVYHIITSKVQWMVIVSSTYWYSLKLFVVIQK